MKRIPLLAGSWRAMLLLVGLTSVGVQAQPISAKSATQVVSRQLDSLLKHYRIPGAQIALIHKDSLMLYKNYGLADVARQQPVTHQTLFRVASVSKTFLALGVLRLSERGKLTLQDRVTDLVPDVRFMNPWSDQTPIRVVHVLEHTTGFDEIHAHRVSGQGLSTKACLDADWKSRYCRWRPGTYFSYCSSAMPMLAYAIERKTQIAYERYMDKDVFTPLKMNQASYFLTKTVQQHLAKGYSYEDGQEVAYQHVLMRASGGLTTNATELANVVRMFLNRGQLDGRRFLSEATIKRMEQPTSSYTARVGVNEGYGLGIATYNYKGFIFYGHTGGHPGYLAQYGYCPEANMGFVLLCNTGNQQGQAELINSLMNYVVRSLPPKRVPVMHWSPRQISERVGYYRMGNSRAQLTHFMDRLWGVTQLRFNQDKLVHKPLIGAGFTPLSITGPNTCYAQDQYGNRSLMAFLSNEEGQPMAINASGGNMIRVSAFSVYIPWLIVGIAIVLVVLSGFINVCWLAYGLRKSIPIRSWGLLGLGLFTSMNVIVWLISWQQVGEPFVGLSLLTAWSFLFYLLPLLLTGLVFVGLAYSIYLVRTTIHWSISYGNLLLFLFMSVIMLYLLRWDVVGFKPWSY